MHPQLLFLTGLLLLIPACGRGGATLETDNVQGEWFPKGSKTSITLNEEHTPPANSRTHSAPLELTYVSSGDGQGLISINGASPETATVDYKKYQSKFSLHITSPSWEINIPDGRLSTPDGHTATLSGWNCHERSTGDVRTGEQGSLTITATAPSSSL